MFRRTFSNNLGHVCGSRIAKNITFAKPIKHPPVIQEERKLGFLDSTLLGEYILQVSGSMSHLKLQKLVYYVQAYHLAYFGEPLIEDDFEAWVHGPVSRKLYDVIKQHSLLYTDVNYKHEGAPMPDEKVQKLLTEEQLELVGDVLKEYGQLKGLQLENLTHSELPWQNARQGFGSGDRCNEIIPKKVMKEYYREQLYGTEA